MPAWHAWAVLALLLVVVVLFAIEKLRVDLVALIGLCALIGMGILTPDEAFGGFGTSTLVMLASVFVIGGALQETGVLEWLASRLIRFLPRTEGWQVLGLMIVAAALSAFMNNTTVTAMLVPLSVGLARRTGVAPSRLLMPLAFASILGGTCTLIGTSTNVAVSGYVSTKAGLAPFGLFEITPLGLVFVGVGVAYMVLVGRHLLPRHPEEDLADDFGMRGFLSEIVLQPGSPLVGRSVSDSDLARMEFRVLKVVRSGRGFVPDADTLLEAGDVLLVTGNVANLMKVKTTEGIEIRPELKWGDADLKRVGLELAEVVVSPRSTLIGRTLREARFQQEFRLTVLAIYRAGRSLRDRISRIRLHAGDLLLVQGRLEALDEVRGRRDLAVLAERGPADPAWRKPLLAMGIFGVALVLGGLEIVPSAAAFLMAAVMMVLAGCLRPLRLYEHVEWRLLVLIGSMFAFGRAMDHSGAADLLSRWVVDLVGHHGHLAVLAGFCLLTVLLTQPMSNAAAALVVLPVSLKAAGQLGIDPRAMAVAVMISASTSLVTPLEPSSVLVFGPGKYRFADFLRVGFPLTLLLLGIMLWLLPRWWPL
ncbi:MAG: SLC13 family permease [Verrucomicrobiales bacterium]|nr:SLC13 family permease [Verrucomicrobiales bacterium]